MKCNFALVYLLIFSGLFSLALAEEKQSSISEEKKIEMLLEAIEKSGAIFIRNGEEHPAKKAKEHLESKYSTATKMFFFFGPKKKITALEFIEKIASQSSTTGKDYQIKVDGKVESTGDWLRKKLKEIENEKIAGNEAIESEN